nr:reverse transcriptase-like protein [Alkalicoccus daliensis]
MVQVYIDGASAGNPGPSGAGIFIKSKAEQLRVSHPLSPMTNHEAEFHACLQALRLCREKGYTLISIRSDAKVLVEAVEKRFVKNTSYKSLLDSILKQVDDPFFEYVFFKWIPTKQNGEADKLAKQAVRNASARKK